jgi:hypothetical protein
MHDKIAALSLTDADRDPTGFADKLGRSFGDTGASADRPRRGPGQGVLRPPRRG